MINHNLYASDFPKQYKVKDIEIISYVHNKDWDSLNDVVICRDKDGKVTARFGDSKWYLMPYSRSKKKHSLNFEYLDNAFQLQIELKLLAYGWLFHKTTKGRCPSFSTIYERIKNAKAIFEYLKKIGTSSLSKLSSNEPLEEFKTFLGTQDYSQGYLVKIFSVFNKAIELEPWLQYSFGFTNKLESTELSKSLSNKEAQQTFVIPERLCDAIYGKAIELIEGALPHQCLIADVESNLQENYLKGKNDLDTKIQNGARYVYTDDDGNIFNNHKYSDAILAHRPLSTKEIISPLSNQIQGITINNGDDFTRYLGQLLAACYIVCGGFSGMRDSELDKLTPKSYYKDHLDGRDFHMLQSSTFKLGEKRETWVTAPIAEKAIELASTLTKAWREKIQYPDSQYTNTLWCNNGHRSKPPSLITGWNLRLKRFCKQFNFVVTEDDYKECIQSNPHSRRRIEESVTIGKPWPLTTHQFRRTLAFYTIKHRLGTKVALKQQFKHLYLSMTEWYTNGGQLASLRDLAVDKKVQQALDEINAEMTASKIFKQWHSNEPLSGSMGKAIVKMRGDVPHIYSSWETIYEAVKKGTLTLHGTAHSYCKNGYDCDMDGVVMPQFCVDCAGQGSIIDKDQALWWQKKHNSLVRYMALGEDISVTDKSHYITQIRAAENVMADFDMPFTPFEPDLKVTSL